MASNKQETETTEKMQSATNGPRTVILKESSKYGTKRKHIQRDMLYIPCPDCPLMLYCKQELLRHRMDKHGFHIDFKCDQCGVLLTDPEEIKKHKANHEKEKSEQCTVCQEKFTTETSLIRHIKYKHTYERAFKCHLCGKSFVEHYKLQIHIRQHTGESPFSCSECKATFRSKVSLNRHLATHSNVREYICILCFQQFSISNTLMQHMKRIHHVVNFHLDGMRNSKIDGLPKIIQLYLQAAEQKVEDFNKVRYYALKEEYQNDLKKHFTQVSPLLTKVSQNMPGSNLFSQMKEDEKDFIPVNTDWLVQPEKRRGKPNQMHCMGVRKKREDKVENETTVTEATAEPQTENQLGSQLLPEVLAESDTNTDKTMAEEESKKKNHSTKFSHGDDMNTSDLTEESSNTELTATEKLNDDMNMKLKRTGKVTGTSFMENDLTSDQIVAMNEICGEMQEESAYDYVFSSLEANESTEEECVIETDSSTKDLEKSVNNFNQSMEGNGLIMKETDIEMEVSSDTSKDDTEKIIDMTKLTSLFGSEVGEDVLSVLKGIFIPFEGDQLEKMKEGHFGKRPQVIEVLEDGAVMDLTGDYKAYIPSSKSCK